MYAKNNKIDGLKLAFNNLTNNNEYRDFSSKVFIDGIWDGNNHNYCI